MKVLSVRQPWAWAIIHGGKDVENRSWSTNYRGLVAIHASQQFDMNRLDWCDFLRGVYGEPFQTMARTYDELSNHPLGAIIGVVEIVDCVKYSSCDSDWAGGSDNSFCWKLSNARPLSEPLPFKGRLGLCDLPLSVLRDIGARTLA